jgi:hypothetical protein
VILGIILGPLLDANYRRAMISVSNDPVRFVLEFFTSPVSLRSLHLPDVVLRPCPGLKIPFDLMCMYREKDRSELLQKMLETVRAFRSASEKTREIDVLPLKNISPMSLLQNHGHEGIFLLSESKREGAGGHFWHDVAL